MAGKIMELALAIKGKLDSSLSDSTRQASDDLQTLERKMAGLQQTARKAGAWQTQTAAIQETAQRLRQAQLQYGEASRAMSTSGTASRETAKAYQAAGDEVARLGTRLSGQKEKVRQLSEELNRAGFNVQRFAESQRTLTSKMGNVDSAIQRQKKIDEAKSNRDKASQRLSQSYVNFQAGMDIAKTLTEPLIGSVKAAIQLESVMSDVRKVVDFDSPQQFQQMQKDILNLSKRLPMTAEDIGKIVAAGGQSGIARNDLMAFAEDAVKMGIAFDITADQAGDMMAKWRTAFKMNQNQVVELADKVNYLGNTTAASAPLISDVISRIGPLGEVGGMASGEIAAMGAAMIGAGVQSDVAATGIKNLILGMTRGSAVTKKQAGAFDRLGISSEELAKRMQVDAKGAIIDLLKAIQQLPKEEQAAELDALFGKESIGAIAPLLTNLDNFQDLFGKVGDKSKYAGSMNAEAATRMGTTDAQMQMFQNSIHVLSVNIGNALLPMVQTVLKFITPIIQAIGQWAAQNPTLTATIVGIAGAVGAVILALLGFAVVVNLFVYISDAIGLVKTAMAGAQIATNLMTAAMGALNFVMSMNPAVLVIIGIMALVAAILYLYNNCESFRAAFDAAWNYMAGLASSVGQTIMAVAASIGAWCAAQWELIKSTAVNAWNAIVGAVQGVWNQVYGIVAAGVGWVQKKWEQLKSIFSSPINTVVNFIKTGSTDAQSVAAKAGKSAAGGVFNRPYLTWVAEAGDPEVIVPINRSQRAMDLWQTAGSMLGAFPDPVTGPVAAPVAEPIGTGSRSVTVNFSPTVNITGTAGTSTADQIRAALEEQQAQFEARFRQMYEDMQARERRLSFE